MGRYLKEAEQGEAMDMWALPEGDRAKTQENRAWTHDFMGIAHHDIPCPVCFDAPAVLTRNVSLGQYDQKAQPCIECQKNGWKIRQVWWREFLGLKPRQNK